MEYLTLDRTKPFDFDGRLAKQWAKELDDAMKRVRLDFDERWYGSTKVRNADGIVIADCTTIEAAEAARRLLIPG